MKREACLQGILHTSQKPYLSGSPVKKPSFKVPFMESLAERCPTTRDHLHSSIKVSDMQASPPHTRFSSDGKGPPLRKMPVTGDFLNISSSVPTEGALPEAPSTERERERERPFINRAPLHPAFKVPGR